MRTMLPFLTAAATLLVLSLAAGDAQPPVLAASPSAAPVIAPCEYDWTFFYGQHHYGIQQYGPVAAYRRNTLLIWRSRAYLIPVTAPWALAIAACVVVALSGFFAHLFMRSGRNVKMVNA